MFIWAQIEVVSGRVSKREDQRMRMDVKGELVGESLFNSKVTNE